MRVFRTRLTDSTFDLNLAPFLDIIVSTVPMLLLSVVFIQVKMIETPVPQVVAEAAAKTPENKNEIRVQLKVSKTKGYEFDVTVNGAHNSTLVPLKAGAFDLEGLYTEAFKLKQKYPHIFRLELAPSGEVELKDLVEVMDKLRRGPADRKTAFVDPKTNQRVETDLMYPDVIFANVVGE